MCPQDSLFLSWFREDTYSDDAHKRTNHHRRNSAGPRTDPPPPKELEEEIGIYKKENSRLQSITKEQEIVLQKLMEEKVRS